MTNLLAIDTATDACSLALWLDGKILESHRIAPRQHSRLALPLMNELLLQAGIQLSQLDGLVLGAGPGSFTGLRIAAGLVQGLAFGLNLPVVSVSTLRSIAQGWYCEQGLEKVSVILEAGMGQVYMGEYALGEGGVMQECRQPRLVPRSGYDKLAPAIYPQARYLARLGYHEFVAGRVVTAQQAQPLYLRPWSGTELRCQHIIKF